jgi:hypothetical protein
MVLWISFISMFNLIMVFINFYLILFTVNKQINDKERVAAAMENPDLRDLVEGCIQEGD